MAVGPIINDAEILRIAQRRLSPGERAGILGLTLLAACISSSSISPLLSSESKEDAEIHEAVSTREQPVFINEKQATLSEEPVAETRLSKLTSILNIYGSAEFTAPDLSDALQSQNDASALSATLASLAVESQDSDRSNNQLETVRSDEVILRSEGDRLFADVALPVSKLGMGIYDDRLLRVSGEIFIETDERGSHVYLDPSEIEGRQPPGFIRQMVKRIDIYDLIKQHKGFQEL